MKLIATLTCLRLEYVALVWPPQRANDIKKIERQEGGDMMMEPSLKHLSHEAW